MIKARTIEQDEHGNWYSIDAVTLLYKDDDGLDLVFFIPPETLYSTVHDGISRMTQVKEEDTSKMAPEMAALKKQMVRVMKSGVKGLLMLYGDKLLTLFYGSKEHPRPPRDKNLDLVDWYMHEFSKVLIVHMMRNDILLAGCRTEPAGNVISVVSVDTRPITYQPQSTGDTTSENAIPGTVNGHIGETDK